MSKCDTINIRRNEGIRLYGCIYKVRARCKRYLEGLEEHKTGILNVVYTVIMQLFCIFMQKVSYFTGQVSAVIVYLYSALCICFIFEIKNT